jgi:hypothetical protein
MLAIRFCLALFCVLSIACGDDGPGSASVGDGLDAGGTDSGTAPNDIPDAGEPMLGRGCDAAAGPCTVLIDANFFNDGDGGDDGGGFDGG